MSCVTRRDLCITRGDMFTEIVALTDDWQEVVENPSAYVVNMVFREAQDDRLDPYLTISATPVAEDDAEYPVYADLSATGAETSSLPDWNHVHYVELQRLGGERTRLYEGKVRSND